jgi:hypothetical protein
MAFRGGCEPAVRPIHDPDAANLVRHATRRPSVMRQDGLSADSLHDSKDDAIARGLELSQRHRGRLRVKGQDGRIELECDFIRPTC